MNDHNPNYSLLVDLIADAIRCARIAKEVVFNVVVPQLPPQRRGIAKGIQKRLEGDQYISEIFVRELTSLMDLLRREIATGSDQCWMSDEHDVNGGHHVTHLDDRAFALSNAAAHLADLRNAIHDALDFAKAGRLADELVDC
jgi:hypothetical protein